MLKTGDPYLPHCIHTGRILAMLVPSSGKRAVNTVVAGILHDVVDDTCQSLQDIEAEFGDDVVKLVAGVSRLSYRNQLLRRHRRVNVNQGVLGQEELCSAIAKGSSCCRGDLNYLVFTCFKIGSMGVEG